MFVLSTLKHTVKIQPRYFGLDLKTTLIDELNRQLSNYVIPGVGLLVTFYDFQSIGASFILSNDASSYTPVVFRYAVFQPFVDEIIEGVIAKSAREGLTVSLHFFQDIFVQPEDLPSVSKFDKVEQIWYWEYNNDGGEVTKFYMDTGKRVRLRVLSVDYNPKTRPDEEGSAMRIKGTMADYGLGCISWWETNAADVQPEDGGEGEEEIRVD